MGERGRSTGVAERGLIPASYQGWFARAFHRRVVRPMFARRFHAVRLARGSRASFDRLRGHDAPVLVLANHPSWWDPLTMLLIHEHAFGLPRRDARRERARDLLAPIDARMLERFRFFRRLGLFGLDPAAPGAGDALADFACAEFARLPRPTLWMTPQGRFTDTRERAPLRPGAAMVAVRTPGVRVLCACVEYAFWTDREAEVFIRAEEVPPPDAATTPAWLRAMRAAFEHNQDRLAELVIARDPGGFETLLGGEDKPARTHPIYGRWLRARGRSARLVDRSRGAAGVGAGVGEA